MFYDVYLQLCMKKNLSPSAAAIQAGINKGTVSVWKKKWEKRIDVDPDKATIDKLCAFFGVQESELREFEQIVSTLMPVAEEKIKMDDALAGIKKAAPGPQAESVNEKLLIDLFRQLSPERQQEELAYLAQAAKRGAVQDM